MRIRLLKLKALLALFAIFVFAFFLIREMSISPTSHPPSPSLVVILVISAADHTKQRQAIRETWASRYGRDGDNQVRTLFAVAVDNLSLMQRRILLMEGFDDMMLLSGANDDYRSLTRKVKVAMQMIHSSMTFSYLLKVDDDSFVMIPELIDYLNGLQRSEKLYLGFFRGSATVKRQGKWAEHDWFLCSHYLPHARGGGYVLSRDLVEFIASNQHWLTEYANEDVSIGTWLAPLSILRLHEPRFDVEYRSRGCNNRYLVMHKISPAEMRVRFSNLKVTGKLCQEEKALYPSYRYNWSANPLNCCRRSWKIL